MTVFQWHRWKKTYLFFLFHFSEDIPMFAWISAPIKMKWGCVHWTVNLPHLGITSKKKRKSTVIFGKIEKKFISKKWRERPVIWRLADPIWTKPIDQFGEKKIGLALSNYVRIRLYVYRLSCTKAKLSFLKHGSKLKWLKS